MFFSIIDSYINHFVIKLIIALIFGFFIGLEREIRKKPIGIRTCAVIAVVSCLLTIVSIEAADYYAVEAVKPMDPLRLAAQIVSGIGFIGAGVILRRHNDIVSGLTTAAILWGAGGIGIAVGAGFIAEAFTAFILIFIGIEVVPFLVKKLGITKLNLHVTHILITTDRDANIDELLQQLKEKKIVIDEIVIEDDGQVILLDIKAFVKQKQGIQDVYLHLRDINEIKKVKVE